MKKITLLMFIVFWAIALQAQNKLLSSIDEYYDGTSWQIYAGNNYEYDSNNNLTKETYYNYDFLTGLWKISYTTSYAYDGNNRVIQTIDQNWISATNKLENSYRETATYVGGKYVESIGEEWDDSSLSWVYKWKDVFSYNASNLIESSLSYKWDGLQWIIDFRGTLTYNGSTKISALLEEKWVSSQWVNSTKTLLTYDANNKIVTNRTAEWDVFNDIFKENDGTDYILDATGNRISETNVFTYNNVANNYKKEYSYDSSSLMSSFANPFKDKTGIDYLFEDFPHVNKPLGYNYFTYDNATSTYENTSRTKYDYTNSIVLATERFEKANATITLFPNPTSDLLNIELAVFSPATQIIITDILGKKIYSQKVESVNTAVNTSGYAKGVYLVAIIDSNNRDVKKLVIK